MSDPTQELLFDVPPDWTEKWRGMPEFNQKNLTARQSIIVNFTSSADRVAFSNVIGQTVTDLTKSIWYPKADIAYVKHSLFTSDHGVWPRHPVYVVSKGRWNKLLTSNSLAEAKIPHFIVVEQSEHDSYKAHVSPFTTILLLDTAYQRTYDTFDDLGDTKSKGPGPARNFAWEHSVMLGASWHWVMDDNIDGFYRLTDNLKTPAQAGIMLRGMEDFVDRYENIGIAGPNYTKFAKRKDKLPPFVMNTRIYSCNLIRNSLTYRWRGRYNEDTDLSLRVLKDGLCTVQFNAFLQNKMTTQILQGGNTEAFYAKEGTRPKSDMLYRMHPDLVRVVFKFSRWHHHVDYRPFKENALKLKSGVVIPENQNDYGMILKTVDVK